MARYEPTHFTVYPTGYEDSTLVDKRHFQIRVELRNEEESLWRITDGFRVLSSAGNWISDLPRHRRFTRFALEDALARALSAVDEMRINGWTMQEWTSHFESKRKKDNEEDLSCAAAVDHGDVDQL